jgi:hypothetical protein
MGLPETEESRWTAIHDAIAKAREEGYQDGWDVHIKIRGQIEQVEEIVDGSK